MRDNSRLRLAIGAAILSLWLASLFFPAFLMKGSPPTIGWHVLLFGIAAIPYGQFAWLGNIFLGIGLPLLARNSHPGFFGGFVTSGLAICAFSATYFTAWPAAQNIPVEHGPAYYLWIIGIFGLSAALLARMVESSDSDTKPQNLETEERL